MEIKISIPFNPSLVSLLRLGTASICSMAKFNVEVIEDIRLSVSEACNIIIINQDNEGPITVSFNLSDESLSITLECKTRSDKAESDLDSPNNKYALMIIKNLMDDFKYEQTSENKKLILTKHR